MALARAGRIVLHQQASRPVLQTRLASTHADTHHHDEHHESGHGQESEGPFRKEDFSSHVWGKSILAITGVLAFVKFAPSPDEDNYVTRAIAHYSTPPEYWTELNLKHLYLTTEKQAEALVIADAKKPPVHRYRYPQSMEQFSPHLHAVGKNVDLSDVVVKSGNA